jgi:hypothetical protein
MDIVSRETSILTDKKNLEHLFTFKDFPVFMGCTDQSLSKDIKFDMSFSICKNTGIIQLDKLLPLNIIYQGQHNDGIGKIWQEHYANFASFCKQYFPQSVLEIGGATDYIGHSFLESHPDSEWTIIEPHPQFIVDKNIKIIKGWFDESFKNAKRYDMIVHSHVFEHIYNPRAFICQIGKNVHVGGLHIFSLPNMHEQLARKYTNCLNFEHTCFLAEPFVDELLKIQGFKILKKEYFKDHSIFYATKKIKEVNETQTPNVNNYYNEYKKLYLDFIRYHKNLVSNLNEHLSDFHGDIFLFGAHVFSQYLLAFGLNENRIKAILDNSPTKQGKRLYGTGLTVQSPEILKNHHEIGVILKVGIYRDEIIKQISQINPKVKIFE